MKTDINIKNPGDLDQFRSVARKRKRLNCSRRSGEIKLIKKQRYKKRQGVSIKGCARMDALKV